MEKQYANAMSEAIKECFIDESELSLFFSFYFFVCV